ncbi:hypothetical protein FE257_011273 [Aspergillus nanangensis]|uniref:Uncharacterized protein n=1 Tax=Aspergillus nanangensis TaxID=2582783 RepID=A0AAD4GSQ1_ASPNN|nr:hypothetical protein FE257_011273 [Aspergillus nanangensis]
MTQTIPTENRIKVPLSSAHAFTPRQLRIVTIGAGYSGLILAHKLRYQYPELEEFISHTIYEVRSDIGGTWLANKYPGVQCDVPAHIYAFPFDPYPDWSKFYASGQEIHDYMKKTVKKWDLDRDVQLNTEVVGAFWEEDRGQWRLQVRKDGVVHEEYADVLVSAQGFLNVWKWPTVDGLHSFQGKLVHSADWDHAYDYANKRIAIIGNGSSGIQILPQLAKETGTEVISFQRGPTWVTSRLSPASLLGRDDPTPNPEFTAEDKKRFREDPEYHHQYRRNIIHNYNKAFKMFRKGSPENINATTNATKQMAAKLNHRADLCEMLIPKWELGCRRVTPGEGYLESFLRDNVSITQSPITMITEDSVLTADGREYKVDVVVCATGFDVSHCPRYPIIGRDGCSLADKWADEPESYLSVACPGLPNYFIFTGPNAVVGHGSLMEALSWVAEYMVKWIRKIASEEIKSIAPRQEVVDEFTAYGDEIHRTLVWTGACRSWYKKGRVDGRVTATFAGSALLFKRMVENIRGEDFDIRYLGPNRFRFLGDGFTEYELDPKNDLAWYIQK